MVSTYAAFLAVAIAAGAPPKLAALVFTFFSNLFSSLTHYGTGPAPVLFGSGYVEMGAWWKLGALISVLNILNLDSDWLAVVEGDRRMVKACIWLASTQGHQRLGGQGQGGVLAGG